MTSVQRMSKEQIARMSPTCREFHEQSIRDRAKEIEMNRIGLYGEARFCTKDCATFYARAVANLLGDYVSAVNQITIERQLANYPWIAKRRLKNSIADRSLVAE